MTPNNPNTAFRSRPRISRERFEAEMKRVGSPWAKKAQALYTLIKSKGHDPAVWLAIGLREHRLLTNPNAVAVKLATNSWTNARSVRLPNVDVWTDIVTTTDLRRAGIENRDGPYVRYQTVSLSLEDGMYRIDDPAYVYRQRYATTLGQIIPIWTEDDPAGYLWFVIARLNEWAVDGYGLTWWDDPDVEFIPDRSGEYGYPKGSWEAREKDLLILHITIGNDSLDHLNAANGSSAHYLTHKNGKVRAQLLPEAWAAWTAGNQEYNERAVQIEHEKRYIDEDWTAEEYRNLAQLAASIIKRNPAIRVDRDHIIGHSEVPDPTQSGRFGGVGNHTDPGHNFDWHRFMAELDIELEAGPNHDPNAIHFDQTHTWLVNLTTSDTGDQVNMLDFWRQSGGLDVCGYPIEGMKRNDGVYRQLCENVLLECWVDGFGHYDGPHYRFGGLGRLYQEATHQAN